MSEDNEHQETHTREDDVDPIENPPGPANLARALEVAEELLQAIKQANPTPMGKQSAFPAAPCHRAPGLPKRATEQKFFFCSLGEHGHSNKFMVRLPPPL